MTYDFDKDGLTIVNLFTKPEIEQIKKDLSKYICSKLGMNKVEEIEKYHKWYDKAIDGRKTALSAKNRHFKNGRWQEIDIVERVRTEVINNRVCKNIEVWDEGYGQIAYRLIRPGFNDGYPASRKSWGPGGKLISATIPIIGFTEYESQSFIIGSHRKNYRSYLPSDPKFCSEERRLVNPEIYKYTQVKPNVGDVIIFHWDTIHTEQIIGRDTTRLALEVRYKLNE